MLELEVLKVEAMKLKVLEIQVLEEILENKTTLKS